MVDLLNWMQGESLVVSDFLVDQGEGAYALVEGDEERKGREPPHSLTALLIAQDKCSVALFITCL